MTRKHGTMDGPTVRAAPAWTRAETVLVVVLILGMAGIAGFWAVTQRAERQRLEAATAATAEQVARRLDTWFADRLALVEHMAMGAVGEERPDDRIYRREARQLMELAPGFQALNYVDTDGVIRVVVPRAGNEPALGKNLHHHPSADVRQALERAARSGALSATGVIDLLQGGRGFATYLPLHDAAGRPAGFLNGVFRIDHLVDGCLAEPGLREHYRYVLVGPEGREAHREGESDPATWPFAVSFPVRIADRNWSLELAPAAPLLARNQGWANEAMSIAALLMLLSLGWFTRQFLRQHRELLESRHRYRMLVENQADMIVRLAPDGRLLYASPSYRNALDLDAGPGEVFLPFIHEDDRDVLDQALRRVLTPPHVVRCEHRHLTERGQVWLSWSFRGVTAPDGSVQEIVGVGRDVTERQELERQLRILQRRQSLILLADGIARHLANSLQLMTGAVEGLLDALPRGSAREEVRRLERVLARTAWLGRRLLNLGRQQEPRPRVVDLLRLADGLGQMLERTLGGDQALVLDLPDVEHLPVRADPDMLEQAMLNLVVALRDLGDGGPVRLSLRPLPPRHGGEEPRVEIRVARPGLSLEPGDRRRLLDPFFATRRFGDGVGMALASAAAIVRRHDADLEQTMAGDELVLAFRLPLRRWRRDGAETGPEGLARGTGEVVLVADPDAEVRDYLAAILERGGYTVLKARGADEIVAMVQGQPDRVRAAVVAGTWAGPDLVSLRDVVPGGMGLLVLGCGEPPAAVLPGAAGRPWCRFLDKPVRRDELLRGVRAVLDAAAEPVSAP